MPTMDFDGQARRTLEYITTSGTIHPDNKELIKSYHRHMLLSGICAAQRQKLMAHLKIIVDHIGETPFDDLEKEDIEELVAWLYTRGTSDGYRLQAGDQTVLEVDARWRGPTRDKMDHARHPAVPAHSAAEPADTCRHRSDASNLQY